METISFWNVLTTTLGDLLSRVLSWTQAMIDAYAERIVLAMLTLALGWLVAVLVRKLAAKGLRAIGLDIVLEKAGLRTMMEARGIDVRPSIIIGWLLYFVLLYSALLMAVERLQIDVLHLLLTRIAMIIPRLIVVGLILAIGWMVGRWLGQLVGQAARLAGTPFHAFLAVTVRSGVILFAFVVALDYLALASTPILLGALAGLLLFAILGGLLVAVCARDLVYNVLSRGFLLGEFKPGQTIRIGNTEGTIEMIGTTAVKIRAPNGDQHFVPNRQLVEETVTIRTAKAE